MESAPSLVTGITLFNQGDYYACHDVLEAIWMEAKTQEKPFYQGILQIAVGLYHLGNHNWRGASILLGEGVNRLRPFEPTYAGVAVAPLVDCGWAWLTALQQVGPDQVAALAAAIAPAQVDDITASTSTQQTIAWSVNNQALSLPVLYIQHHSPPASSP
ncbi:MAG: DUF309 domain-containing protein [Leptolyngbya sp. LCM1.Bin17]|nr:MAG: DUF309 domain-containing protein [Leptolyngbya sp. LCM1.Bin17]